VWLISLPLILTTFGIIFIAELPDKTAITALLLATRFKARDVILGAWLAFFIQTLVALLAGSFLTLLPVPLVRIAAGLGFLIFAAMAFLRKEEAEEKRDEEKKVAHAKKRRVWLTSFLIIFAAEWGDLTQLATAALVAQNRHPLSVGIGAILALWAVTMIAVVSGSQLNRFLNPKILNFVSGFLFAGMGLFIIGSQWPFFR
jgi:putative Ca2+/H+ antiporter (TMEM165/GDT1 family)